MEAKRPRSFSVRLFRSEQSDCHMFIQAAPERFNLVRISVTLRCLRQIKGRKMEAEEGKREQIQAGFSFLWSSGWERFQGFDVFMSWHDAAFCD